MDHQHATSLRELLIAALGVATDVQLAREHEGSGDDDHAVIAAIQPAVKSRPGRRGLRSSRIRAYRFDRARVHAGICRRSTSRDHVWLRFARTGLQPAIRHARCSLSCVKENSAMLRLPMPFVRLAVAAAIVLIAPVAHAVPLRGGGGPSHGPSDPHGARPPRSVCAGLQGAPYGLCVAYCEAQNCDQRPHPSCRRLRKNFQTQTGSDRFPCDGGRCGDAVIDPGEQCDPPGAPCNADGGIDDSGICTAQCTCPIGACPTRLTFTGTSTTGVLDVGWTGLGHDATVISNRTVTLSVQSCTGTAPHCGVCTFAGPVPNAAGEPQSQRCKNDSSIACTADTDCGANGPCKFFVGSYLPFAVGGVPTCVANTVDGTITGTADIDTGSSASSVHLAARVFTGGTETLSNPCPQCNGGTCSGGARSGESCTPSGSSPNEAFGTTSLDCPPAAAALIAVLPIDLSSTTGTETRTLSAASPNCRAPGFTTLKCQCDTCNNGAATPCSTNADCTAVGATVCGGRRCVGGSNSGAACSLTCAGGTNVGAPCTVASQCPGSSCTSNSQCPSGFCRIPGQATAPNQCSDSTCSTPVEQCVGGPNDNGVCTTAADCPDGTCGGPGADHEGICAGGPFELFCGPVETFRGCNGDGIVRGQATRARCLVSATASTTVKSATP